MEHEGTVPVVDTRYRLERRLGAGGQGEAWLAYDVRLRRRVVLKLCTIPEGVSAEERQRLIARAEREARAAGKLKHPGIVTVHDQFSDRFGLPWIVMEHVDGRSLREVLDKGPLHVTEAARIGEQIATALAAAHAAGVVHRDIKPANILLEDGRAVIADFGIATMAGEITLTPTGTVIGTPQYMSPERILGGPASSASDMWSLGATLYRAVEGRAPFTGDSDPQLILAVSRGVPEPMRTTGALQSLIGHLMRFEPAERPAAAVAAASMREIVECLPTAGPTLADIDSLLEKATKSREEGALEQAEDHYRSALDLAIEHRARQKEGWAWDGLGSCRWRDGDPEMALKYFTRADRLADETGDAHLKAWSLYNLGVYRRNRGELTVAKDYLERSLEVSEAHRCPAATGWTHHQLAELARHEGDTLQEREHYAAALRVGLATNDNGLMGWSLIHVARYAEKCGDLLPAGEHYAHALEIGHRTPHNEWMIREAEDGLARIADSH
ncbi:protein kinase domain-containing protein [Streptomyces caniscabiei]|uniref:non-specific serine/threonine protein kinase n=1 Tax=Streptomyces caniscabiei TaxID=2746961 RepID=A0ABU4MVS9_9ACTN|nr:serine/threonine-protein kinase [Streptomyces caniscabiei]MBE4740733.1 serine/threonine protein kinase [Streptomyces caniscabiei]MBE4759372.1 serine/threonine protein kinase [Streptomyces caniscabiei]MBE4769136.1 serine/threonine protein kinase [Streptomyces caniscabiei]MBE4788862.1 serine/threonine protein kinase [Streptomyces caniscabiei]MBE4798013.1 serine/threonine protein kinase [Streptomyces caniscabiei]